MFDSEQARVVLYKRENAVIELKFDAQGSDKVNWFQKENLTEIPWDDVETENQNFFSIEETRHGRSFLINRGYGTCTADIGWMIITGNVCAWEKRFLSDLPNGHVVLYSTEAGYTNWNTYGE